MKQTNIIKSRTNIVGTKRWAIAQTKCGRLETMRNRNIEGLYHRLLNSVKTLYMKRGEAYFDRDYKGDKTESLLAMHTFLCKSIYWNLECDLAFTYGVTFAFSNCPFEVEVRKALRTYPLSDYSTEVTLRPNLNEFYNNTLAYQDKRHIYVLNG